ncbi:MAG: hypothetical protein IJ193_03525 [Bacilli bacterium]|nr:hypothetical protein [Bacilli bacterium]
MKQKIDEFLEEYFNDYTEYTDVPLPLFFPFAITFFIHGIYCFLRGIFSTASIKPAFFLTTGFEYLLFFGYCYFFILCFLYDYYKEKKPKYILYAFIALFVGFLLLKVAEYFGAYFYLLILIFVVLCFAGVGVLGAGVVIGETAYIIIGPIIGFATSLLPIFAFLILIMSFLQLFG